MRKILFTVVIAVCFGIFVSGCTKSEPTTTAPATAPAIAPAAASATAPAVDAGTWFNTDSFSLKDHKDKIVVVEFWATWCPPCKKSIPHLKELHEEYSDKGVFIVSLTNEPASTIESFMKTMDMPWIIGADSNSGSAYKVTGIPTAFIVSDGQIVWKGHPMAGLDKEVKKLVEAKN
jgi:thiol-disulfide isomerase/thioredoxin